MYLIYRATHKVNNKQYIGFTVHTLYKRKQQHIIHARHCQKYNKVTPYFWKALNKYGEDAFIWEVLYMSKDLEHCRDEMEDYFIQLYDTYASGYNSMRGGNGGQGLPGSRNGMFGRTHTNDVKQRLSDLGKQRIAERGNPATGKTRADLSARNKQPKRWVTDGTINKLVLVAAVPLWQAQGFQIGRTNRV